jgi:hypothetical protein
MSQPEEQLPLLASHASPEGQLTALGQLPLESQIWTSAPLHWVVPGMHVPRQTPLTHAWPAQAGPTLSHAAPVALHFSGCCPQQSFAPGMHKQDD